MEYPTNLILPKEVDWKGKSLQNCINYNFVAHLISKKPLELTTYPLARFFHYYNKGVRLRRVDCYGATSL